MNTSKRGKPAVSLPILIGAIVIAIAIIAILGYRNFGPPPAATEGVQQRVVSSEERQQVDGQTAWLKAKARETGGDWHKLSAEDQQRLKMIAKDESATILKFYAQAK